MRLVLLSLLAAGTGFADRSLLDSESRSAGAIAADLRAFLHGQRSPWQRGDVAALTSEDLAQAMAILDSLKDDEPEKRGERPGSLSASLIDDRNRHEWMRLQLAPLALLTLVDVARQAAPTASQLEIVDRIGRLLRGLPGVAPDLLAVHTRQRIAADTRRLLAWFDARARTRDGLASLIMTAEWGPFAGLPVAPDQPVEGKLRGEPPRVQVAEHGFASPTPITDDGRRLVEGGGA